MKKFHFFLFFLFILTSCAVEDDVFPSAPTTTDPDLLDLPNPISLAVDETNNQVLVVNSNGEFSYDTGSLALLSVDATDPDSPAITASQIITAPNFAGKVSFDGTSAYIPYREKISEDDDGDQIVKYTIAAGSITEAASAVTCESPFGTALDGGFVYVVCNDTVYVHNTSDLTLFATVDLTTAESADIDDTESSTVQDIAIVGDKAFISNRSGNIFVVDTDTLELTHVIAGPLNTRAMASDGTYIYGINGDSPALFVFDPSKLTDPTDAPEEVDDGSLLIATLDIGADPEGLVIDTTDNVAYVSNSFDLSVSGFYTNPLPVSDYALVSLDDEDTGLDEVEDSFAITVGTVDGEKYIFVGNYLSNNISVIRASTLQVVGVFP